MVKNCPARFKENQVALSIKSEVKLLAEKMLAILPITVLN